MTKEGFEVYKMYLAMQRHFSTDYDFFKYNGKVNVSVDAYQKRNDIFSFEKLTKIIPRKDRTDFFVAHFLDNPKEWIKSMSKEKLDQYKAKMKNLPITFRNDLEYIKAVGPSKMMVVEDIPLIHKKVMEGEIAIETLLLIDGIFPFINKHAEQVTVPFVWPDHLKRLRKYNPFFQLKIGDESYKYTETARAVLL